MSGRRVRAGQISSLEGPARRQALLAGALALLGVALAMTLLAVSGWLIAASGLVGIGALAMIDIFAPGAVIRAAAVGRTAARYGERLAGHDAMLRQLAALRLDAFRRLMTWPVRRLSEAVNGDLLTRLTRDIDVLELVLPRWWLPNIAAFGGTVFATGALARWAPSLLPVFLGLSALGLLALLSARRGGASAGRRIVADNAHLRAELATWMDGLAELIMLDRARERSVAVMVQVEAVMGHQRAQRRIEAVGQGAVTATAYLSFWGILIGGLALVSRGELSAPLAAGLALLALGLVEAWQALPGGWILRTNADQAAERIEDLAEADLVSRAEAGSADDPYRFPASRPGAALAVDGVWFSWSQAAEPTLRDVELELDPGERVLIEGVSGSGKSTLGKLLSGELTPDQGRVQVASRALYALPETERFRMTGRLEQSPVLFRDTLARNLQLGSAGATASRLMAALDAVDLAGWCASLPDGLSTWLGELGAGVSGGQARRLSLARLLLSDHALLVLDEPLAGLDRATANRVVEGIEPWLRSRTVVILSHDRFGPTEHRRLAMKQGRLVEAR